MKRGMLITIEGTDCSGKQTQSELLVQAMEAQGIRVKRASYPWYDSPTGRIVGGPYLGKSYICEGWFPEGATEVDPKVAAMYFAADRLYHSPQIEEWLNAGINVILDRYVESNMAHQGGKLRLKTERRKLYKMLEQLEYRLCKLRRPDMTFFLYMPYDAAEKLRKARPESSDQHEASETHLRRAEQVYLELAEMFGYIKINCARKSEPKSIKEIHKLIIREFEARFYSS